MLNETEALYLEAVEASQAREYRREPLAPYWEVEEGSAAEEYRRAWELCDDSDWSHEQRLSLNVAGRTLRAMPQDGAHEDVFGLLEPGFDKTVDRCRPALDAVLAGSVCIDATSPLNLWDEWRISPEDSWERMPSRFTQIGKLQVLRAYESWITGNRDAAFDDAFAAMRMQMDIGRGATLVGLTTTSSQFFYSSFIRFVLDRRDLEVGEAERVYAELGYLLDHAPDFSEALQNSFVSEQGWRLRDRDIPKPSGAETWDEWQPDDWESFVLAWVSLHDVLEMHPAFVEVQTSPVPDRLAAYAREEARNPRFATESWHPAWLARSIRSMDLRVTFTLTYLQLLQVAAADTALVLSGVTPEVVSDLEQFDPGIDLVDPFTLQPFEIIVRGDGRYLRSPALDDPVASGLEYLKNFDHEAYLEIPLRGPEGTAELGD